MAENTEQATETSADRVVCPARKDTAVRYAIFAALLIGFGIWCYMDRGKYDEPDWQAVSEDFTKHINPVMGYALNHWGPYVFVPLGLILGVLGWASTRKTLVADPDGIGYEGKDKISWQRIEELDASELKRGYLYLEVRDGETLTLDQYKLQNFKPLVAYIEGHVPASATAAGEQPSAEG